MHFRDLFQDPATKGLSHTRLWSNIGSAMLTVVVAKDGWVHGLDEWRILAYGTVVCASAAASKWLSLRYANGNHYNGSGPAPNRGGNALVDGARPGMAPPGFPSGSG